MNIIINGEKQSSIESTDRGLQYGDGLFETIALRNGKLQYWQAHLQRLNRGCDKLNLPYVTENTWLEDIKKLIISEDGVVKLMITRGSGGRGYNVPEQVNITRIVSVHDYPSYPDSYYERGVKVKLCKTSVSINSSLAGIKHLNRLENVLARNECRDEKIAEGLMCNDAGYVIEGTMTNLFAVQNNALYTPILKQSGIEGIIRNRVIELAKQNERVVQQINITLEQLLKMDEVFLTNSLIGIWPVMEIEQQQYGVGPVTRQLMEQLDMEESSYEL